MREDIKSIKKQMELAKQITKKEINNIKNEFDENIARVVATLFEEVQKERNDSMKILCQLKELDKEKNMIIESANSFEMRIVKIKQIYNNFK